MPVTPSPGSICLTSGAIPLWRNTSIQELENIDIIYMVRECGLTPEALSGLLAKVQAAPNAAETKEKEDASIET